MRKEDAQFFRFRKPILNANPFVPSCRVNGERVVAGDPQAAQLWVHGLNWATDNDGNGYRPSRSGDGSGDFDEQ